MNPDHLSACRGRHAGETIVVCGCGQSLRELVEPGRYVTIGVNDVGRLFDPTYLVVVNPRTQFKKDRFKYVEASNARVLFTQLDLGRVRPPVVRFQLGQYGGTEIGAGNALHYTQNSPYVAVCLAAYLGATRIGLIGVDLTDHHFFADTGRHSLAGRLREIDSQYGRLAQALEARGVELVNLSSVSRLASLPRGRIEGDGSWTRLPPLRAVSVPVRPAMQPERMPMKVSIERRSHGAVGQLLDALAASAAKLGHVVVRDPRGTAHDPRVLSIVWNGRGHRARGSTLYCEHGWLPRSEYQISPRGINADSHLAPFAWDGTPLTAEEDAALDAHIAQIKAASFAGYYQYMQADKEASAGLPPEFVLVPLQIESDTNLIRHAPAPLRRMQSLIDCVSKLDPPWPIIFKQHPADALRGNRHVRLRLRRPQDLLWPQSRGNIHQMLKGGGCRAILTINSNVAHDGLLWDVPAVVLGRNVWPSSGARTPFLTAIPRDWSQLRESVESPDAIACRRAYAHYLMQHQWSLEDARDPRRVAGLLGQARTSGPVRIARTILPKSAVARPRVPVINVVAENRGWLFEAWKRRFGQASVPGFQVVASERALRDAHAWIYIRTREANATRDPARTVVQLHDLGEATRLDAAGLARCAGLSLTHPAQEAMLAARGIDLGARRVIVQPVGWSVETELAVPAEGVPTLAWVGRADRKGGGEGIERFIEAVRGMRTRPRVVLVGERLEAALSALKRMGIDCRTCAPKACPLHLAAQWLSRFDCVVPGGTGDSGPWPLFDALHAGVPVVAPPSGWAERLLADGRCGRLAGDAASMSAVLDEILGSHEQWRAKRPELRASVAQSSLAAWVRANLELAVELARPSVRQAA